MSRGGAVIGGAFVAAVYAWSMVAWVNICHLQTTPTWATWVFGVLTTLGALVGSRVRVTR